MVTVGKSIYHDNPRKLAIIVGDRGLQNISISIDDLMQDYRIFIKRSESEEKGRASANQLLFTLLQAGMIDQMVFSNLYDRASPDLVAKALRTHQRDKALAQSQADRAQNTGDQQAPGQEAQLMQMMAGEQQQQEAKETENMEVSHDNELEKIALKEAAKTERDVLKKEQ